MVLSCLVRQVLRHDGYFVTYFHPWEFYNLKEHPEFKMPFIIKNHCGHELEQRLDRFIKAMKADKQEIHYIHRIRQQTEETEMITLATVSPCYNEEEVLEQSAAHLTALFDDLIAQGKISNESVIVFVNDGSRDRTWEIITRLHKQNARIRGINLAHNVGHQNAIMAGMMTAKDWADAVITLDADLRTITRHVFRRWWTTFRLGMTSFMV